ncbi:MAG TPA: hypothetical protein VK117_15485 [Pyrinomonadaceae bacterium]|nr:hypothetical protein [Pyrinomonadaceae bacterium]
MRIATDWLAYSAEMAFGFPPRFSESRTIWLQPDELRTAVKSALENAGWSYQILSDDEFVARIPMTGWSWGEELTAKISPDGMIQVVSKCHGYRPQIIDFGKNRTNVELFFALVQHAIAQGPVIGSATEPGSINQTKQPLPHKSPVGALFFGCTLACFLFSLLMFLLFAVIGLLTGTLYIPGRGHEITLHGIWARIVSGLILLGFAWVLVLVFRNKSRKRLE